VTDVPRRAATGGAVTDVLTWVATGGAATHVLCRAAVAARGERRAVPRGFGRRAVIDVFMTNGGFRD
jgi:hypothetical protein